MRPCTRGAAPECLRDQGKEWSAHWKSRCEESEQAPQWSWGTFRGQPVNQLIMPHLKQMTQAHCSYCDGFPLDSTGNETIDHFKPKNRKAYPELAFIWENLFLACENCQKHKGDKFKDLLLRPDEAGYDFGRYFVYNELLGDLEPNPQASQGDQQRARVTICLLGLNRDGRPSARKRELARFLKLRDMSQQGPVEEWPYRFLVAFEFQQ